MRHKSLATTECNLEVQDAERTATVAALPWGTAA